MDYFFLNNKKKKLYNNYYNYLFCIYNVYYGYCLLNIQCVLYENTHYINAVDIFKSTTGDIKQ